MIDRPKYETVASPVASPVDPPDATAPVWDPELAGFTADVLCNPTTGQVRDVARARTALSEIGSGGRG